MIRNRYQYGEQFDNYMNKYMNTKMRVNYYLDNLSSLLSINNSPGGKLGMGGNDREIKHWMKQNSRIDYSVLQDIAKKQINIIEILKLAILVQKCLYQYSQYYSKNKLFNFFSLQQVISTLIDKCQKYKQNEQSDRSQGKSRLKKQFIIKGKSSIKGKSLDFVIQKIMMPYLIYLRKRIFDVQAQLSQQHKLSHSGLNGQLRTSQIKKQINQILKNQDSQDIEKNLRVCRSSLKEQVSQNTDKLSNSINPEISLKTIMINGLKEGHRIKQRIQQKQKQDQKENIASNRYIKTIFFSQKNCQISELNLEKIQRLKKEILQMIDQGVQQSYYLLNTINKCRAICKPMIVFIRYFGGYWGCIEDFNINLAADAHLIQNQIHNICKQIQTLLQMYGTLRHLKLQDVLKKQQEKEFYNICTGYYKLLIEIESTNQQLYLLFYNCYYNRSTRKFIPRFITIDRFQQLKQHQGIKSTQIHKIYGSSTGKKTRKSYDLNKSQMYRCSNDRDQDILNEMEQSMINQSIMFVNSLTNNLKTNIRSNQGINCKMGRFQQIVQSPLQTSQMQITQSQCQSINISDNTDKYDKSIAKHMSRSCHQPNSKLSQNISLLLQMSSILDSVGKI